MSGVASQTYADRSNGSRACVRLTGLTPAAFVGQTEQACGCEQDHAASLLTLLQAARVARREGGHSVQAAERTRP